MCKEKIKELRELKSLQQVPCISVIPQNKCIPFQIDCISLLEHKFNPLSGLVLLLLEYFLNGSGVYCCFRVNN